MLEGKCPQCDSILNVGLASEVRVVGGGYSKGYTYFAHCAKCECLETTIPICYDTQLEALANAVADVRLVWQKKE